MPAVTFTLRWPDGREGRFYSPSTLIYQHLDNGARYRLDDFLARAEAALNAASERVYQLKGFYCSAAMDTLGALRSEGGLYAGEAEVQVIAMHTGG